MLGKEVVISVVLGLVAVHFVSKEEETDHQKDVSLPESQ
jgi:hypothetical protein